MQIDWTLAVALVVTSGLAALGGVLALAALQSRATTAQGVIFSDSAGGTSFLFDGEFLVDATPSARAMLSVPRVLPRYWAEPPRETTVSTVRPTIATTPSTRRTC